MKAEVIAIGDELISGQRVDTNSSWISQRLAELGIRVVRHATAGDDLDEEVAALRRAFEQVDAVVCTGGLGPTADDLTRQALAQAAGVELELNEGVLSGIRELFARRKRPMPSSNAVQAMFPKGARVLPNPHGTAPGIDLEAPRPGRSPVRVLALPGVPAEIRDMWPAAAAALRAAGAGSRTVIHQRRIHCFGAGESALEQMLPDLTRRRRHPTVGITASQATITLRVTAEGASAEACEAAIEPTVAVIRRRLGSLVFGEGDDQLQDVVVRRLNELGRRLATVEWGVGGLLASWLSDAAGSSSAYAGGVVFRQDEDLRRFVGHTARPIAPGRGGGELAKAMAAECRVRYAVDYALAAGPFPGRDAGAGEPAALHFALAAPERVAAESVLAAGHPEIIRARSAKQALNFLRLALLQPTRILDGPDASC